MKRFYIPLILDTLFIGLFVFLAVYAFFSPFWTGVLPIVFAIILAVSVAFIFAFFYYKRLKKEYLSYEDSEKKADLFYTLPRYSKSEKDAFFKKLVLTFAPDAKLIKNGANTARFYSALNDTSYAAIFSLRVVTADDILCAADGVKNKTTVFFLNGAPDLKRCFGEPNRLSLICGADFFKTVKENGLLPDTLERAKVRLGARQLCINLLKKENGKKYLFFGLFFITFSFIVPLRVYYAVCGFIFFILFLTVKFATFSEKI